MSGRSLIQRGSLRVGPVASPRLPSYAGVGANVWTPARSAYNWKASNTRRYQAGLAAAALGGTATELWIGDSVLGGCTGLGPPATFDRPNAIPRNYERAMAAFGVPTSGSGIIQASDGTRTDARVTNNGFSTSNLTAATGTANGNTLTFTSNVTAGNVAIIYYDYIPSTFTISVNAASSGAGYLSVTTTASVAWKRAVLTGVNVTAGSTVVVTIVSGAGNVIIQGCDFFTSTGLSVHNAGCSGTWLTAGGYSGWLSTSSGYNLQRIWGANALYRETPCVVHYVLGYFDLANNGYVLPANYVSGVQALRAVWPNSDFVLHAQPMPLSAISTGASAMAGWNSYLAASYSIAEALDCPLLDAHDLLGGGAVEQTNGLTGDTTVHLKTPAYNIWGRAAAALALS